MRSINVGYIKIFAVGLYWLISTLLSLQGIINISLLLFAIFIPKVRRYTKEQWIADDRRVNAFFNGRSRNTVSSRIGYKVKTDDRYLAAKKVVNKLFYLFEKEHIENETKNYVK